VVPPDPVGRDGTAPVAPAARRLLPDDSAIDLLDRTGGPPLAARTGGPWPNPPWAGIPAQGTTRASRSVTAWRTCGCTCRAAAVEKALNRKPHRATL